MSEVSDRYRRVATGFAARLEQCPADRLDAPSPCESWKARDVISHVVHVHRRVVANLDGSEASEPQEGDDLAEAFRAASGAVIAALDAPRRAGQMVSGMFGTQSFEDLVGRLLCADTLVHTWDLARATGQDDRLDLEAAAKALEFLTPIDEAIRRPGGFGPRAEAVALDGAEPDVQAQLLAFTGRNP
ncbi:MAG: TIGR03086 family protein [Acidobacteriota bacterium]|nr:TIGR03086 family protein [Acidobacteriota bacterium]